MAYICHFLVNDDEFRCTDNYGKTMLIPQFTPVTVRIDGNDASKWDILGKKHIFPRITAEIIIEENAAQMHPRLVLITEEEFRYLNCLAVIGKRLHGAMYMDDDDHYCIDDARKHCVDEQASHSFALIRRELYHTAEKFDWNYTAECISVIKKKTGCAPEINREDDFVSRDEIDHELMRMMTVNNTSLLDKITEKLRRQIRQYAKSNLTRIANQTDRD